MNLAILMYSVDHDERLPHRAAPWMDATFPYIKNEQILHCPEIAKTEPAAYGYAFNNLLCGRNLEKLADPPTLVMLYDSNKRARNAADPVTSLANPPRHKDGNNIGFVEGHVKWLRPDRIKRDRMGARAPGEARTKLPWQ